MFKLCFLFLQFPFHSSMCVLWNEIIIRLFLSSSYFLYVVSFERIKMIYLKAKRCEKGGQNKKRQANESLNQHCMVGLRSKKKLINLLTFVVNRNYNCHSRTHRLAGVCALEYYYCTHTSNAYTNETKCLYFMYFLSSSE